MMHSSPGGGRTQETAAWLLRNLQDRAIQSFAFPTGCGGHTIASVAVSQWRQANPDGVALVIVSKREMADQWKRSGLDAITHVRATREIELKGTILGHAPADVGLVIVDETGPDPLQRVSRILASLPATTVIEMKSGGLKPAKSHSTR